MTSIIATILLTSTIAVGGIQNVYAGLDLNVDVTKTCTPVQPFAPGAIEWQFDMTDKTQNL